MSQRERQIQIISYEGSSYRTDFWEGQGREFEDLTERKALGRLLPPTGGTLVEIGAGFGRLADLYQGYDQVVLVDYSLSLLAEAKDRLGDDARYKFVAANVYHLPLVDNLADVVVMIRVAHHLADVDAALTEIQRILRGGGVFVMEFANKRNAKAIARFLLKKQSWSPFAPEPYEFVSLNFDFHPGWMKDALVRTGFQVEEELAISNFRLPLLKKHVSPALLARIDNVLAGPGARLALSPSVVTKNRSVKQVSPAEGFFVCPKCRSSDLSLVSGGFVCADCQSLWPVVDGIVDFRYPRPTND